jgi:DNA-directed RNA polymerase subunit RPC12/RpoP
MVDILADGTFGRDDGVRCHACGSKTFLSFDQGCGLKSYNCEKCDEVTTVQYEREEPEDYDDSNYYENPFEMEAEDDSEV